MNKPGKEQKFAVISNATGSVCSSTGTQVWAQAVADLMNRHAQGIPYAVAVISREERS